MPTHPLTAVKTGGPAKLYVQQSEPAETPQPAPEGDGGVWYPTNELATGVDTTEQWTYDTTNGVFSGVATAGDTVVLGDAGDTLYALSLTDGSKKWKFSLDNEEIRGIESGIAIADKTVVFADSGTTVYGLSLQDGSQQWSFDAGNSISSGIEIADGIVVFGSDDNTVYGLSLTDGTQQWSHGAGGDVQSGVAIADGTVVVGSNTGEIYGLSLSDGTEQWVYSIVGSVQSGVGISDGTVVVGSDNTNVYGLSLSDGTEQWVYSTDGNVRSGVAIRDGTAFIGNDQGSLYALSLNDGQEKWEYVTGAQIRTGVAAANGCAIFGNENGLLVAASIDDGGNQWQVDPATSFSSGIAISDRTVVIGGGGGTVYGFPQNTDVVSYGTPHISTGTNWIVDVGVSGFSSEYATTNNALTTDSEDLKTIAGENLSVDTTNNELDATGSSGITSLSGGTGITPSSIGDGDTVSLATGGVSDTELSVDPFVYEPGMTSFEKGLSNEELNRIVLQSGEQLVVERVEFRQKGGGSSTSASIDVYDVGASSTVGSQTLGGTTTDPGSSGTGNTVLVRLSNSTGGSIKATPRVQGYITGV